MKKYLFTSAAALAFCGLFTSCTHDLGSEGSSAQNSVVKTYEQAFVTAFGQPDPNQEWGFGTSVASTRAMTRDATNKPTRPTFRDGTNNSPDFSKPDKPTFYNSVAEAKQAGATIIAAEGKTIDPQHNTAYSINSSTTFNQLQNFNGITLYVTENTTFSPSFSANGNTIIVCKDKKLTLKSFNEKVNVYLAPGAELDLSEYSGNISFNNNGNGTPYKLYLSSGSKINGGVIYIDNGYQVLNDGGTISSTSIRVQKSTLWNEGTITLTGDLTTYNGESNIFNAAGKTFTVKGKLDLTNNKDLFYNNGTLDITGNITLKDGTTQIVNNGTLTCNGNLDMTAGGAFHNVGTAVVSGHSYIYNTNSFWVNDGHYTTGTFDDQNCEKVFNSCHMTVTGTFYLGTNAAANGHSFFVLEGGGEGANESGAYVFCDTFMFGGNTDLWLGNKSFLEVTKEFKSTNVNSTYGTHGPSSGSYAVIKAASFTKEGNPYISMTYYGNLYIDTPIHYAEGTDNANPYYRYDSSVQFSFKDEKSPVKIPKTDCNPGYGDDPGPDPDAIRVICEDLSVTQASDWDFNDAVFDVKLVENNSKVQITLRAAGGTLLLNVAGREVHELFKEFNPNATPEITSTSMVSTGSTNIRNKYTNINLKAPVFTIENNFGTTNVKEIAKNIPVQVYKLVNGVKDWYDIVWQKGAPSARIGVGTDYNWCDERVDIRDQFRATNRGDEYPTFNMYVQKILEDNWYTRDTVTDAEVSAYTEP